MAAMFWGEDRPPTLREYPKVLLRSFLGGAVVVSIICCLVNLIFYREALREWPQIVLYGGWVGGVFATSFFVCCGLPWTYLRPFLAGQSDGAKWILVPTIGALGAMLAYSIATGLTGWLPGMRFWGMDHFGIMLLIEAIIGAILAVVIGSFKRMQRQIAHEKEMRERTLSEAAARAQALALQAQINPHFFFNTLNTLSALVSINPEAAQEMIGRLADMFRYTLACSRDEQVTLTEELAFVANYLKLEKARFTDRLRVTLPEGQFNDVHVPGLSLQPLIENAIKHGIAKLIEGGEVTVAVYRGEGNYTVEVVNPSDASAQKADFFRDGHALSIVRQRLALRSGSINVKTDQPGQVRVSLLVPA